MVSNVLKKVFLYSAGHTYSNLSRLFLRLFTGMLFLQFGLRQIIYLGHTAAGYDGFLGLSPEASVAIIVTVELIVAVCIMLGALTRIAVIPGLAIMCYVEALLFNPASASAATGMFTFQPGYPIMFIGIFIYMLLAGPGKISVDYLIAVNFDRDRDEDEVLENA